MWCFYSPCVLFACLRPHVWLSCVLDLVSLIKWHRMWMNPGSVHRLWNIPASKRICMKRVLGLGPIINRIQFFNNQLYLLLPFQLRTCPDIWTSFTYEFQKLFRESGHDIARSCLFLNAANNRQWPESGAFTLLELLSLVWAAVLPGWDVQEAASTTPACTLWIQKTHMCPVLMWTQSDITFVLWSWQGNERLVSRPPASDICIFTWKEGNFWERSGLQSMCENSLAVRQKNFKTDILG